MITDFGRTLLVRKEGEPQRISTPLAKESSIDLYRRPALIAMLNEGLIPSLVEPVSSVKVEGDTNQEHKVIMFRFRNKNTNQNDKEFGSKPDNESYTDFFMTEAALESTFNWMARVEEQYFRRHKYNEIIDSGLNFISVSIELGAIKAGLKMEKDPVLFDARFT